MYLGIPSLTGSLRLGSLFFRTGSSELSIWSWSRNLAFPYRSGETPPLQEKVLQEMAFFFMFCQTQYRQGNLVNAALVVFGIFAAHFFKHFKIRRTGLDFPDFLSVAADGCIGRKWTHARNILDCRFGPEIGM